MGAQMVESSRALWGIQDIRTFGVRNHVHWEIGFLLILEVKKCQLSSLGYFQSISELFANQWTNSTNVCVTRDLDQNSGSTEGCRQSGGKAPVFEFAFSPTCNQCDTWRLKSTHAFELTLVRKGIPKLTRDTITLNRPDSRFISSQDDD
ncbi:hypothetical protein C8R45DRAFT_936476 [Mycena sanguinolenta]|nr:hypothetical protein C8R45DRAFT_936476 [Mycena sanguinolenta]